MREITKMNSLKVNVDIRIVEIYQQQLWYDFKLKRKSEFLSIFNFGNLQD